ncbi:MAG: UDP-glucose/GDP-mannose dehydrogenase family protein [Vampirovibrionales bacterium]|nr:UDP-glucose/GDP-mannose dehydrogenase family protein [Vampirovibrionales bacterium]
MKVCIIGTGYVGLVAGTGLAEMGNDVVCVDNDARKIETLKQGQVPIYEPGLEELMKANTQEGRLAFTTDLKTAVQKSQICIIAVGTPQGDDGSADLSYVLAVAKQIAEAMNGYKVIVTKSTVPVGTSEKIRQVVQAHSDHEFSVVSNPEFLKQGAAVDDFLKPDRVVIGADSQRAFDIMRELYSPFLRTGNPIINMDIPSAEMTKYAANAFLATKISFINEISRLCEKVGADVSQVRTGISSDRRIGSQFLFPGLGYGGSCFPKDVKALIKTGRDYNTTLNILESVDAVNQSQRNRFVDKILAYFEGDIKGKTFAVWGLAFKPRTDDMREAPSITIINALLEKGATIQAFDPKAMPLAKTIFKDRLQYTENAYDALKNTDALLLLTEWNEFRRPDFDRIKTLMNRPVIFDGRNQYEMDRMQQRGFEYFCIGRLSEYETHAPQIKPSLATPVHS